MGGLVLAEVVVAVTDTPAEQDSATSASGCLLIAAAMALPLWSDASRAESAPDRGVIAYKYLDYLDSQPDAKRIRVRAQALSLFTPISSEWSFAGTVITDAISGASPAFHSYGLGQMHDRRNAVDAEVTRYSATGSWTIGASHSKESDYLSKGISLKNSIANESKNTTWTWGLSANDDAINPTNGVVRNETKRVHAAMAGITQVVSPVDLLQVNVSLTASHGYLSDPYKVMDERPRDRLSRAWLARWNHHFEKSQNTFRGSYRYFADDWSIRAHTLGAEYVVGLPNGWTVTPLLRLYSQTAAKFYVDADVSALPFPANPPAQAVHYSEDQRLSAFGARTLGGKISKQINPGWVMDFKYENYQQRAEWQWGGGGSPGLLPFNARMIQVGVAAAF